MTTRDKIATAAYTVGVFSGLAAGFATSAVAGLVVLSAAGLLTALLLGWRR